MSESDKTHRRPPIHVRRVWDSNLEYEFSLIQKSLPKFPLASLDTEFPGTVFEFDGYGKKYLRREPTALYALMKRNVDASNLIQLGLTISDADGNLPCFDSEEQCLWEFNFKDFDSDRDLQNPVSISLLRRQGIDFAKNRAMGVDSRDFAMYFKLSGLGLSSDWNRVWITFHGLYDFGYMLKILTGNELPCELQEFRNLVMVYFGKQVYDLKNMLEFIGLHGGLEHVARILNVDRAAGRSHQAGSDSLLTMHAFCVLMKTQQRVCITSILENCNHKLYGCCQVVG